MKILSRLTALTSLIFLVAAGCSISFRTSGQLDGGVFRSRDGGITWAQIVNAGRTAKGKLVRIDDVDVRFIRFDPTNPSTLYLVTRGAGIYRSDDRGDSWIKTGLSSGTYSTLAIDPSSSSILYAAVGGTIIKSTDGGKSFVPIYFETKPDRVITDLTVSPGTTRFLLAAMSTGEILQSVDYGNTWKIYSSLGLADSVSQLFFAPGSTTTLYALTVGHGLLKSDDVGRTWTPLSQNLSQYPGTTAVSSMTILQKKPSTIYIATNYGLLVTQDGGASWTPIQTLVPFNSQPIQFVAVNFDNTNILYVMVGNRLRKSEDGGSTWDAKISLPTGRLVSMLTLNPNDPNELYIGTLNPRKR
ncbi:MAG: hypothetical protein HY420_02210 [Candidatus Kerfeldbacteria bacterium]|nr:hypothetical protein [Candidatus Kerfeldbacteria bacterium]